MVGAAEGFGVDFVDVFGAGGAGGEPAIFCGDLEAADAGVVAGGFGEDGGDGFAGELFGGDLRGGEFGEFGFLVLGGCGVDALVGGAAVLCGEVGVELAGVFAGAGGHLGGEEAGDEAVFVGGPDLAVAAEEGGAGGLFADEAEGAVDEAVDEPLEAYGDFHHGAVEAFGYAVDDAGGDEGFADADAGGPAGAVGEEVLDADAEVVVGVEQAGGAGDDAVAVVVGVGGEGYVEFILIGDHGGHGEGAGAVHADASVPVAGHEAEGGVDVGVEDL